MSPKTRQVLPIVLFVFVFLAASNWWKIELLLDPIKTEGVSADHVVLYATSWCNYCEKTRRYFDAAGIPFTEYDIENSPHGRAHYKRLGGRGVPLITIGDATIHGFDTGAIRSALEQRGGRDELSRSRSGVTAAAGI